MYPTPTSAVRLALPLLLSIITQGVMVSQPNKLPPLTRSQILAKARLLAEHSWICNEVNRHAPCVKSGTYRSDWQNGQRVTGIAYDWGGMDDTLRFGRKLKEGHAAGSHSRDGVTSCTAGIDCSGFVSYCWGQTVKYSTNDIRHVAGKPKYNWFTDMKPGDALNKAGSHIVLFVGYDARGGPIVYEAAGGKGRVVLTQNVGWSRYQGYTPLQYKMVVDE